MPIVHLYTANCSDKVTEYAFLVLITYYCSYIIYLKLISYDSFIPNNANLSMYSCTYRYEAEVKNESSVASGPVTLIT